jgi:peroxiredoxin
MRTQSVVLPTIAAALCVSTQLSIRVRAVEPRADGKTGEIVVRVVDDANAPQPDAVVSLFTYDPEPGTFVSVSHDRTTDASGIVRLEGLLIERNYLVRATTHAGQVGYRQRTLRGRNPKLEVDLKVVRPVAATIHVRNEVGAPVSGASIGSVSFGEASQRISRFGPQHLIAIGLSVNRSTASGELVLPELPAGTIDLELIHPDYAPAELKGFATAKQQHADFTLLRGVKLKLRIEAEPGLPPVQGLQIEFRHEPDRHDMIDVLPLAPLGREGTTEITLASGKYSFLTLFHPSYLVTPVYEQRFGAKVTDEPEYFELPGGGLAFRIQRRVRVRGHVLDEATHKPVSGVEIDGKIPSHAGQSPLAQFTLEWTRVQSARTNERGEFELDLAAGPARLFVGREFISRARHYQIDVASDGSTVAPDILVRRIPKVHGIVLGENGKRLPGAIVRFRGSELTFENQAVVSDAQGEFKLSTPFMPPLDPRTDEPQPERTVVAFDPRSQLAAERRIRLDDEAAVDHIELRMKPQDYGALLTSYPDEFVPWMQGNNVAAAETKRLAAISLVGKPAPELDGATWLNTDKPRMSLADFRGKYVLLQFWATWCGPCHQDMANVKLAYDLYKDKGLAVIGIHDNSMPLDAIKEDVAKNGLSYPIVVDHPDGRLYASYREHGMAPYYPSYVLIGPDGKILRDDHTVAGPTLSILKIEIIRKFVMTRGTTTR